MRRSLLALTASAFAIGTSEFVIVGLLPQLARDFAVSIPRAGVLVTAYALSVTFGSPLLALALGRIDRRTVLLLMMSLFVLGNVLCALAPGFGLLLAARILTALCHGAFFGVGAVLAAGLVPRSERAQAIALMFTGLAMANILGVPAGAALGLALGWRAVFWALVPLGVLAGIAIAVLVPRQPIPEAPSLRRELRAVLRLPVQLVLAMSTASSIALFCVLTYIAPMLEQVTRLSPHTVTLVLGVFGVGITLGNIAGGWLSDRSQIGMLLGGFTALVLIFAVMPFALPYRWPAVLAIFVWGLIHFAAGTPMQPRTVEKAHGANLASTLNQSAFNFGNALGASLGGLLLTRGVSYRMLPVGSAAVALLALALALVTRWVEQRERRRSPAVEVPV